MNIQNTIVPGYYHIAQVIVTTIFNIQRRNSNIKCLTVAALHYVIEFSTQNDICIFKYNSVKKHHTSTLHGSMGFRLESNACPSIS